MKKQILLFVMMLLPMVMDAEIIEIDGIYYNLIIKAKVAEVSSNPNSYSGVVIIPDSVIYDDIIYTVNSIAAEAFKNCEYLTSIQIPSSVQSIGDYAFWGCGGLTSIIVDNNNSIFDSRNGCNALIKTASNELIRGCQNTIIPDDILIISDGAFNNCYTLSSITIPQSITKIGDYAFYGCNALKFIDIPNSVISIGTQCFQYCTSATSLVIGNNVKTIGSHAFNGCTELTSVVMPNSVTNISFCIFWGCSKLTEVTLSDNISKIETGMFNGCSSLKSIIINDNILEIGEHAFRDCSSLESIIIPNSVTSIGGSAFSGCTNIKTIIIGCNVIKMGDSNSTSTRGQCFSNCPNLTDFYMYTEQLPTLNNPASFFEGSYVEYATLHVPATSISLYESVEPWKNFKNIVMIEEATKHTLTYIVDGEVYKVYELEVGESITPEPAPTKEGYTFSGWSEIPETMPDHDVIVTGTFYPNGDLNIHTLTYIVDGEVYKEYEIEEGESITPEPVPTKQEYIFSGWSEIPGIMPDHDVTVTGTFYPNGDLNKNGQLDIGDAVMIVNILVGKDNNITKQDMPASKKRDAE